MFVVECSYGAELDTPKSSELQSHKLVCSFLAWSMGVGVLTHTEGGAIETTPIGGFL